jgi:hypothetical protein
MWTFGVDVSVGLVTDIGWGGTDTEIMEVLAAAGTVIADGGEAEKVYKDLFPDNRSSVLEKLGDDDPTCPSATLVFFVALVLSESSCIVGT